MQAATLLAADAGRRSRVARNAVSSRQTDAPMRLQPAELECHRRALMGYARRALRNTADAEDAVQDTLSAALQYCPCFAARSSLRTWLHGILKHKIIDTFRRQAPEPLAQPHPQHELLEETQQLFDADGHWREAPANWGDPEAALLRSDFHAVLEGCIASLPKTSARIYTMRELMGLEVEQISDTLGISTNACNVALHRARLKLRTLLEQRWFGVPGSAPD